jgi:hypothetical protein
MLYIFRATTFYIQKFNTILLQNTFLLLVSYPMFWFDLLTIFKEFSVAQAEYVSICLLTFHV